MLRRTFRAGQWRRVFLAERAARLATAQIMVFGHNSNLKIGAVTFHVQTEDRGVAHGLIDTTVYFHGRVLHRRTNNYLDLLPLDEDREQALKLRLDEQHRTVIEEIRSGALQLNVPPVAGSRAPEKPASGGLPKQRPASPPQKLLLELTNAKSWMNGKHATLQISVREENGAPMPGAKVLVEIEGSENREVHRAETSPQGLTLVEFEMPRLASPEAALVIRAEHQTVAGQLRFALRAKSRVPSV
jgi:hypothetical protein